MLSGTHSYEQANDTAYGKSCTLHAGSCITRTLRVRSTGLVEVSAIYYQVLDLGLLLTLRKREERAVVGVECEDIDPTSCR